MRQSVLQFLKIKVWLLYFLPENYHFNSPSSNSANGICWKTAKTYLRFQVFLHISYNDALHIMETMHFLPISCCVKVFTSSLQTTTTPKSTTTTKSTTTVYSSYIIAKFALLSKSLKIITFLFKNIRMKF